MKFFIVKSFELFIETMRKFMFCVTLKCKYALGVSNYCYYWQFCSYFSFQCDSFTRCLLFQRTLICLIFTCIFYVSLQRYCEKIARNGCYFSPNYTFLHTESFKHIFGRNSIFALKSKSHSVKIKINK